MRGNKGTQNITRSWPTSLICIPYASVSDFLDATIVSLLNCIHAIVDLDLGIMSASITHSSKINWLEVRVNYFIFDCLLDNTYSLSTVE